MGTLRNPDSRRSKQFPTHWSSCFFLSAPAPNGEEIDALMVTGRIISALSATSFLCEEECKVYIVCADSEAVKSWPHLARCPCFPIFIIYKPHIIPFDPRLWSVEHLFESGWSLNLIDWIYNRPTRPDDNEFATIAEHDGLPVYQMILPPNDFVATGGNGDRRMGERGFSSKINSQRNNGNRFEFERQVGRADRFAHAWFMGINHYIKWKHCPTMKFIISTCTWNCWMKKLCSLGNIRWNADGPQIE